MNRLPKYLLSTAACLVLLLVVLKCLNVIILRSLSSPNILTTSVTLLFPPDNLYSDLAYIKLNSQNNYDTFKLSFNHAYNGRHSLNLSIEDNKRSIDHFENMKINGSISCVSGTTYGQIHNLKLVAPFVSRYGSGIILWYYNVPNDLPLEGDIECDVSLKIIGKSFDSNFAVLKISKESDI